MPAAEFRGSGTADDPWVLKTPSLRSEFEMYRDPDNDPPILVCTVGKTVLHYHLQAVEDLHAMLGAHGDWMELGNADEQKPAKKGTVEAWARSTDRLRVSRNATNASFSSSERSSLSGWLSLLVSRRRKSRSGCG